MKIMVIDPVTPAEMPGSPVESGETIAFKQQSTVGIVDS
jgi:hypothetical protein